jgi:haloacetate dehalogenase
VLREALPLLPPPPDEAVTRALFPGFSSQMVAAGGANIRTLCAGSGPPLLLLHGHPQTHVCWHKIAGRLAEHFSVVLTDLRGYGDSSKPDGGERSVAYSPRAMARDQLEVMRSFGHERFGVAGHDRGGRVAHRMALDFPTAIARLAVLDIAPTLTMYRQTNQEFATRYVWWFFQIQAYPIPEHLIGMDPEFYLREHVGRQNKTAGAITDAAMSEYLRCYCASSTIHALCEDYRAAAGIGLELDAADDAAKRKIIAPLLALWGSKGVVGQLYDVLATWRDKADDVSGGAIECGHLLAEEAPEQTLEALLTFFSRR